MVQVKNKSAAPVQITAEQILREALERQEAEPKPPKQKITDPEELADYRYAFITFFVLSFMKYFLNLNHEC
jgi:hypothetical protein